MNNATVVGSNEVALEVTTADLIRLVDALPIMACISKPEGLAEYFNVACRETFGITDSLDLEAVLRAFHPGDLADIEAQWDFSVREGRPFSMQVRLRFGETFRWHQLNAHAVKNGRGEVTHWVATAIDIEEQKKTEVETREGLRAAQEANRLKDDFLATLSHELRTPLNAMLGWAQMLKRGLDPIKANRAIEAIERNALAQAKLVDDLLDISRIASGKLLLDRAPTKLRELVDAAVDTLKPTLDAKHIQLTLRDDADNSWIDADSRRMHQVLWNLLSNAAKFTSDGGHVSIHIQSEDGRAHVTITDNGRGIEPHIVSELFKPFRQGDPSTTRAHGGLGLGLAISREIISLHGGEIRGQSNGRGTGSTFKVSLPAVGTPKQRDPADAIRGLRVLIVEDEADARELLSTLLRTWGVTVLAVDSVDAALAAIVAQRFDMLLSDIGMPFKDGYSLIREIRKIPDTQQIPAAAVTAFASARDRQQALEAGFQVHVSKPIDPSELRSVLERLSRTTLDAMVALR